MFKNDPNNPSRRLTWIVALLFLQLLATAGTTAAPNEVVTNESVIKMHAAGLPAEVILAKIRTSQTRFDTSVDALIALSEAGIPKEVLAEMTSPSAGAATEAPKAPLTTEQTIVVRQGASATPNVAAQFAGSPCPSPGIFVESPDGLREIDPTTYTQGKSGGHFLSSITYGIKSVKSKAVIQGTTSHLRAPAGSPVFYFCFEETETGLSYETSGATNPSEFLLVEFSVDHKKRHRWFVTGKLNTWVGAQSGAPPKVLRETGYEKLIPGVYRVTPRVILTPGEYGFYYAGSAPLPTYGSGVASGGKKIFAFSVVG